LAKSFIKEEPEEEIRELEEALNSQSHQLQESFASSEDADSDSDAGVGVPLGLPVFFRNLFNTALDRLRITANHIDIEVEDQLPAEGSDTFQGNEDPFVSLNFHVDSIEIDSVTTAEPKMNVVSPKAPSDAKPGLGRRRMRIENIYARLISDADNFKTMSHVPRSSRSSSPEVARSVASSGPTSAIETSTGTEVDAADSMGSEGVPPHTELSRGSFMRQPHSAEPSVSDSGSQGGGTVSDLASEEPTPVHLTSSVATTDEDRFADAAFEDGLNRSVSSNVQAQLELSAEPSNLRASSVVYDDEEVGFLEYALRNSLLGSGVSEASFDVPTADEDDRVSQIRADPDIEFPSAPSAHGAASYAFSPGEQNRTSFYSTENPRRLSSSSPAQFGPSPDNLDISRVIDNRDGEALLRTPNRGKDDLSESKTLNHEDAESMYMSAISGQADSNTPNIPGGWQSSPPSSQGALSDTSGPIPEAMYSGSILGVIPEPEGGYETPRPSSPQSAVSPSYTRSNTDGEKKPHSASASSVDPSSRLAKLFLAIDEITVWFPLGLEPNSEPPPLAEQKPDTAFSSVHLTADSIFQDVPGSFSSYASYTAPRSKVSTETSSRTKHGSNFKPEPSRTNAQASGNSASSTSITVEVGSVTGQIDISTGRIIFQLVDQLVKAMAGDSSQESRPPGEAEVGNGPAVDKKVILECTVTDINISWLERLMTESTTPGNANRSQFNLTPPDAILKAQLNNIHAASKIDARGSHSNIRVGKFLVSSLDNDILSFLKPKSRPRRSIGSSAGSLQNDIEIDLVRAGESRVTIVTRPVKVTCDLEKLDEALSSFGGFSGILELGSSISSSNATNSPIASPVPARPRGVHFGDAPPRPATDSSNASRIPKIQIQLGDVTFMLKGKSCAVQLQTTTLRAAIRESNVRLKIAEMRFSGPHLESRSVGAPLIVEVKGITVNFLFTPEETDLTKLISMITPSKDPYENNEDILVDILLRQRRKGSVLRIEVDDVGLRMSDIASIQSFESLGVEVAKFAKVAKYLPDDDRPGILTLATVRTLEVGVTINDRLGDLTASIQEASIAHVGVPSLLAVEAGKVLVTRGEEVLLHELLGIHQQEQLPMIMMRIIGDELEPLIKVKLFNVCAEYRVSTVLAALGLSEDGTPEEIAVGIASSVATITGIAVPEDSNTQRSESKHPPPASPKPLHIDVLLRSCALGLNPRAIPSKALFVLTDAHLLDRQSKEEGYSVAVELRKASIHVIDDVDRIANDVPLSPVPEVLSGQRQLSVLSNQGYVSLGSISGAMASVTITGDGTRQPQVVEVGFRNDLFVLESCADSTQTLIAVLNGLQPPRPPNTAEKYRTVVPLQDMMESFTGDAMAAPDDGLDDQFLEEADLAIDEIPNNLEFVGSTDSLEGLHVDKEYDDDMLDDNVLVASATSHSSGQPGDQGLLDSYQEKEVTAGNHEFDFNENYFAETSQEHHGTARKWSSKDNKYHLTNEFNVPDAPLRVVVRDVNVVWNLFDGYDWPRTRDIITQAVDDVEARAEERRQHPRSEGEDEDFVEQDFLFNSVWIGVPIKDEKGALAKQINHDIDDLASETGSYATSTATRTTGTSMRPWSAHKYNRRRLKLGRSKNKKIAFDLSGISVDLVVFPPGSGETQSSLNVRIRDFNIYDHVPTSTWNKFVTSMVPSSMRELSKPMINLEVLTVTPVTELAASELVIRVTVLPLRLHVDQDALDFITRFFEFKDESAPGKVEASEQPFIQRLEVMAVKLKLDYKPKRVDYRGLRSGHTTEFMNFLILDGADILLRHAIVYGITSFDKLHKTLNDVWMPDVKRNQLPRVLSGLAAVRPIVNVGSGVRDLVVVPMREYKKDGRIVRSLQKGVYAFAKNTTSEVARLGAKVAIGTQTLLEGAENFLSPQSPSGSALHEWETFDKADVEEEKRAVSHYAHQPLGVKAGLRSAARHLERDLLTAKDAVIAIPAEIMEEGTGVGMAKAIARRAPTVILRPALGATKAVSNALLGVGNALDKDSGRKIGDVSPHEIPYLIFTMGY
jgi:autophagy-related protein 2